MRGGARPIIVWLAILVVAGIVDAIWTGDLVQIAMVLVAVLVVGSLVTFLVIAEPDSLRSGEPGPRGPEPVIRRSFAAFFTAIGLALFVFGWDFGKFALYAGAGMMVLGLGRLIGEWRAQQKALRAQRQAWSSR